MLRVFFCWFCQNKTLNSAEKNSQYASGCGQSRQRNASFLLRSWEKNAAQWKNQFAAFPAEQGRAQWQKREGRGKKGLLREIFWQQKKKTEKFSFLYCEFYSEQKILPESSIVRKSIWKKQKVLREIFSAEKIAWKKQSVIIYIQYTKWQIKSCASGETGREGERAGRRNTAFPKCRLPKGDAEPQVIIFIKLQKKTLNRRPRWDYWEFFSAKNKENSEKCSRPQGPSAPPYYREQVTASVAV